MLPDAALVVRGGYDLATPLARSAAVTLARVGRPGLSVYAADLPLAELVRHAALPHAWLHTSTAGVLGAWFELEWTGAWPHATVWLPDLSPRTLRLFAACFSGPWRSPERFRNRSRSAARASV